MHNVRRKSAQVKPMRFRVILDDPDRMFTVADRKFRTYRGAIKYMLRYTGTTRLGAVMLDREPEGGGWRMNGRLPRFRMLSANYPALGRVRSFARKYPQLYRRAVLRGEVPSTLLHLGEKVR
jgi:hypothetical protein